MSEVRTQLAECIAAVWLKQTQTAQGVADAILERFEVTPKPVVTMEQLGGMCAEAFADSMRSDKEIGQGLNLLLSDAGLKIVRVSGDE